MIPADIVYPTTIAYDTKLMQPGCAIIAAGMGADTVVASAFNVKLWLTHPTDDMQVLPITDRLMLQKLVEMTEAEWELRQ